MSGDRSANSQRPGSLMASGHGLYRLKITTVTKGVSHVVRSWSLLIGSREGGSLTNTSAPDVSHFVWYGCFSGSGPETQLRTACYL